MRNDHQVLLDQMVNVWDNSAQPRVMKWIVDAWDGRVGYAYPSISKMARTLGYSRRWAQIVIEQLEAKEAIQRLGVDRRLGCRNRIVITLPRAIARARLEAQVVDPRITADTPMAQWPLRVDVKRALDEGCDPGFADVADRAYGRASKIAGGCDPWIAGGAIPGSHRSPSVSPSDDLLKNAADAADPPRRAVNQRLPGLGVDTPHPQQEAKQARDRRYDQSYWEVADVARWVLEASPADQAALNAGVPLTLDGSETDRIEREQATKARCRQLKKIDYARYIPAACASEFFLFRHPEYRRENRGRA